MKSSDVSVFCSGSVYTTHVRIKAAETWNVDKVRKVLMIHRGPGVSTVCSCAAAPEEEAEFRLDLIKTCWNQLNGDSDVRLTAAQPLHEHVSPIKTVCVYSLLCVVTSVCVQCEGRTLVEVSYVVTGFACSVLVLVSGEELIEEGSRARPHVV